jgi:hypothetical protein
MHSLDTVKTRQQGDRHWPSKYDSLGSTYRMIWQQEGIRKGLYGGVKPAAIGSFSGTSIFFGVYEWSKRIFIDNGLPPSLAYLSAGLLADLAASPVYVPTEVIKTRLQLQGRFNNPHFDSGYNYRGTMHAARTIARTEGVGALFHGYRATLYRDLPFSALQFTFYENGRDLAKWWMGSREIGLPLEFLTGAAAGGLAGTITCPLDVVKTRIQTQLTPTEPASPASLPSQSSRGAVTSKPSPLLAQAQKRYISTSSPSTSIPRPGAVILDTSSVMTGLKLIYQSEGVAGWFRGVGPRAVWTSIQSSAMLVLYQALLRQFEIWRGPEDPSNTPYN